jgi:NitT/TauT family transport system substrate-binding protein
MGPRLRGDDGFVRRDLLSIALITVTSLAASSATAADRIRVAMQRTGTLAWELDVIKAHGLDHKAGLQIDTIELAGTEAGKIALKGGAADLMLSDWLWVARERSLGDSLVFYPSSSTLGAVMVAAQSPIKGLADLKGRKLAVAGGPLDKSWLLLQALARRSGVDLRRQATIVYGAPPLLSEKQVQGETDATLAIVGYTFDSGWAVRNASVVDRFLDVTRQAKEILAASDAEWQRLAPRIGARDPAALAIYRARYREGIVRRPLAEEEADARGLYRVLAEIGGAELVGPADELAPGTFYRPVSGE